MGGLTYHRILTGTALALILALPGGALGETAAKIDAAVPMPSASTLPPPTVNDIIQSPASETPAAAAQTAPAATSETPTATGTTPAATGAAPAAAATAPAADSAAPAAAAATSPAATTTTPPAETAVAAPPTPPDPLAALDPADRPIAEKIRDLLEAKSDKIFESKKERSEVEAFYKSRTLAPLWLDKGVENARAEAVIARLKSSDADGLDPKDYKIPDLAAATPEALAEAELKLTATVITFTRHLQAGRFPYQRISAANIGLPQQPPEVADVLAKLAASKDIATTINEFEPPHAQYRALKAKLAELRGKTDKPDPTLVRIPDGPTLKPGVADSRVPLLRKHFKLAGGDGDLRYDDELVKAVKAFQKDADLAQDGIVGPHTLRRLNGEAPPSRSATIDKIIANMERWRWYPRDLGKAYVIVNIPEYRLRVFEGGSKIWETKIVAGKPSKQTPLLAANMKYITVNPTWNVPPSIINNEYLPALQQDPTVLDRMGLKLVHNRDGSIRIYQPPGAGNALGRVRFNFPNRFLVYQHDTPDKYLFKKAERAYSHGCMRVQDPPKYAEVLLGIARPGEHWTAERIKSMYGRGERDIQFQKFIPVYLTYQTASVVDGKLVLRKDIYGYDAKMIPAIKHDRGVVLIAKDRPPPPRSSTVVKRARLPEPPRAMSFFEALFGGFQQQNAEPRPRRRIR